MTRPLAPVVFALCTLLMVTGCDDDAPGGADGAVQDAAADSSVVDGARSADTQLADGDGADTAAADVGNDVAFGVLCPGGAGCPCELSDHCDGGLCGDSPAGRVCYPRCADGCPGGWSCRTFTRGGASVSYCSPTWGLQCRPCDGADDCQVPGLPTAHCADYGAKWGTKLGGFCGAPCTVDGDCPKPTVCASVATRGGTPRPLCVALEALTPGGAPCACSVGATGAKASTLCSETSGAGDAALTCAGARTCDAAGLSGCVTLTGAGAQCTEKQCEGLADGAKCEADGEVCSPGDACKDQQCIAGAWVCPCEVDADCAGDGDLCNGVAYCATESDGTRACKPNPATVVTCATGADTPCQKNTCQPKLGVCKLTAAPAGTPCDDGTSCTTGDVCAGHTCKAGVWTCGCKSDADCAKADDGDLCNGTFYCDLSAAKCAFNPATVVSCPTTYDTACAKSTCDKTTGACALAHAATGTACDDGNACTGGEVCTGGVCGAPPSANQCACKTDADCAGKTNGDLCKGPLYCDLAQAKCVHNPMLAVACGDASGPCATPTCDPKTGKCSPVALPDGATCDADGNTCTPDDACKSGACSAGTNVCVCAKDADCAAKEDGNLCNGTLYCDGATGSCKVNPTTVVSYPTAGDTACLRNRCAATTGVCAMSAAPEGAGCDDDNPCTVNDSCTKGTCVSGTIICQCQGDADCAKLDDGDPCSGTLFCDLSQGGVCAVNPSSVPKCSSDGAACDDGLLCTLGDRCVAGACKPLAVQGCDDKNPCTTDVCDPKVGCVHLPTSKQPCNDGDPCTGGDVCAGGKCSPGKGAPCDDGKPCTTDTCDAKTGCTNAPLKEGASCDDGDSCTQGDSCKGGTCSAHTKVVPCDDGVPCTKPVCSGTSCSHVPVPAACDDKLGCTLDLCHPVSGCVHTAQPLTCHDGKPCTQDVCDLVKGCVHSAMAAGAPCVATCGESGTCVADQCKINGGTPLTTGGFKPTDANVTATACAPDSSGVMFALAHRVPKSGKASAMLLKIAASHAKLWDVTVAPTGTATGAGVPADLDLAPGDPVAALVGTASHAAGKTGDDVWFALRATENGAAVASVAWPVAGKQQGAAVARVPGELRWAVAWNELEGDLRCRLAVVTPGGAWAGTPVDLGAGMKGACHGLTALPEGEVVVTGRQVSGTGQPLWGLLGASTFGPTHRGSWTLPTSQTKDAWAMDAARLTGGDLVIGGLVTTSAGKRRAAVWRVDRRGHTQWSKTTFMPGDDKPAPVARVIALPDGGVLWGGENELGGGTQVMLARFTGGGAFVDENLLDKSAGEALGGLVWTKGGGVFSFTTRVYFGEYVQWSQHAVDGKTGCEGTGVCMLHSPTECDDGNPCTRATCDPKAGCKFTLEPAAIPCDDGQPCTGDGTCLLGICKPGPSHWGVDTGQAGVRLVDASSDAAGTWLLSRSTTGQVRLGQLDDGAGALSKWPLPSLSKGTGPDARALLARGSAAWVGGSVQVAGKGTQGWLARVYSGSAGATLQSEALLGGTAVRVVDLADDHRRPRFAALVERGSSAKSVDTVSVDAFEPSGALRWSATLASSASALPRGGSLVAARQGGYFATWRESPSGAARLGYVDARGALLWTRTLGSAPATPLLSATPGPLWLTTAGSGGALTTTLRQANVGDGKAATAAVGLASLAPQGFVAAVARDGADLIIASTTATLAKGVAAPTGALRVSRLARDGTLLASVLTQVAVSDAHLALAREPDGDWVVLGTTTSKQQVVPFAYRLGADLSTTCGGDGLCKGKKAADCADNKPCTWDGCDPGKGCVHIDVSKACDDGDACTVDTCNGSKGCVHSPTNHGKPCAGGAGSCLEGRCRWGLTVGLGDDHSCAVRATGAVACWGEGGQGEVALDGKKVAKSAVPTPVPGVTGLVDVDGAHTTTVGRQANGSLVFWGQDHNGLSSLGGLWKAGQANPSGDWGANTELAASAGGLCVRRTNGSVACSGDNSHWQADAGQSSKTTVGRTEVTLPTGRTAVSLCRGQRHACVALDNGQVSCWGANAQGQVKPGAAGTTKEKLHTFSLPVGDALKVACGVDSTCAAASGGKAWCWGRNHGLTDTLKGASFGDAPATIATPAAVPGVKDVAELVASRFAYCARSDAKLGGEVWCFGDNSQGGLGRLSPLRSTTPLKVALPAPAVDLASAAGATADRFCAVLITGRLWCWGTASGGELGDDRGPVDAALPFEVPASRL